jgi:hypothetical protein
MRIGLPLARALWHYKMCLFDTSRTSIAGVGDGT